MKDIEREIIDNIKIEKAIPFKSGNVKSGLNSLLLGMDVNDSFSIPIEIVNSARTLCSMINVKGEKSFTIQKQEDGKFRCWRIK